MGHYDTAYELDSKEYFRRKREKYEKNLVQCYEALKVLMPGQDEFVETKMAEILMYVKAKCYEYKDF